MTQDDLRVKAERLAVEFHFSDWPQTSSGDRMAFTDIVEALREDELDWRLEFPVEDADQSDIADLIEVLRDFVIQEFEDVIDGTTT